MSEYEVTKQFTPTIIGPTSEVLVGALAEVQKSLLRLEIACLNGADKEAIKAALQDFMQAGPLAVAKILKALGAGGVVQSSVTIKEEKK